MCNLFKTKSNKIYKVTYMFTGVGFEYDEIVRAKDQAHAWRKLKWRHPYAVHCVNVKEIKED